MACISIVEVFPAAAGGFFSAKTMLLGFLTCINSVEVFLAASGVFFFDKNDVPWISVPSAPGSGFPRPLQPGSLSLVQPSSAAQLSQAKPS